MPEKQGVRSRSKKNYKFKIYYTFHCFTFAASKRNRSVKMAHTFLYTTENQGYNSAVKFESPSRVITEFVVTILNEPDIHPFVMKLEDGSWTVPQQSCEVIKAIETELIEAARRFQR
jgi:hypothetical protein